VIHGLGMPGQILVSSTARAADVEAALGANPHVLRFAPDLPVFAAATPNDEEFPKQFSLHFPDPPPPGMGWWAKDADIDAPEAWEIQTGDPSVVVAVLDTGIYFEHPDFGDKDVPNGWNIWTNPLDLPGNGDEDGNGFVDDHLGYDFCDDGADDECAPDNDPSDEHSGSHGTLVSGIIGARGNNEQGVAGIAWNTSLMALKTLNSKGESMIHATISAIQYATHKKVTNQANVRVINMSLTIPQGNAKEMAELYGAIKAAGDAGILVVAAAGQNNQGVNIDDAPIYPAAFDLDNLLVVAASDAADGLWYRSNYGAASVDLAAPGVSIQGLDRYDGTKPGLGTSFAAPQVSGVAALYWSEFQDATVAEVRAAILAGVDKLPGFDGKVASGGRLNARRTLEADFVPPVARLISAPDISTPGVSTLDIEVVYEDTSFVRYLSLDTNDIAIRAAGQTNARFAVTSRSADAIENGSPRRVTYRVTAPSGGWNYADSGRYDIYVRREEVLDEFDNAIDDTYLGTFDVWLSDAPNDTFVVNTADDSVDAAPGDGFALDSQGQTSLRAAIQEANTRDTSTTIYLPHGAYSLSRTGSDEDFAATGDLDIRASITLIGASAKGTIVDAANLDRVLDIHLPGRLQISKLTLTGGRIGLERGGGGAVRNASDFDADEITVRDNRAELGGGIYFVDGGRGSIRHSAVINNFGSSGGGVSCYRAPDLPPQTRTGLVTLSDSTVSGNTATSSAGGVDAGDGCTTIITSSTIAFNSAPTAGGVKSGWEGESEIGGTLVVGNGDSPDLWGSNMRSLGFNMFGWYEEDGLGEIRLEPTDQVYFGIHFSLQPLSPRKIAKRGACRRPEPA